MTDEHLYIAVADKVVKGFVEKEVANKANPEVIEIGCGPARITPLILQIPNIHLTAIDYDLDFINYAKKVLEPYNSRAIVVNVDVSTYVHSKPVDVFYSQCFHHHVQKGKVTEKYLKNIYNQLKDGGIYVLGYENPAEYANSKDRLLKIIVWYSHIISNAKKSGFNYLAQEEAKTLLDDLYENYDDEAIKSNEQIDLVLNWVDKIDKASSEKIDKATFLAETLLEILRKKRNTKEVGDTTVDLSRGDYKISDAEFRKEIEGVGFKVEKVERIGPSKDIGGLHVYLLRK
jgi:SAM-dependent methyltransferase